jgi:leucyl/phenylalanyl-tRNA--protein transferase
MLLNAYAQGYFPMAEQRSSQELFWFSPEMRGVLPLAQFHIPKSLLKLLRKQPYRLTLNQDFVGVIRGCAEARPETWINTEIEQLYTALQRYGYAHSVECWDATGQLAGGLYGVALQGAFFGESMFSRQSGASKIALVALVAALNAAGYTLLDTQYLNHHLVQFGVVEIPRAAYLEQLADALQQTPAPLQLTPDFL